MDEETKQLILNTAKGVESLTLRMDALQFDLEEFRHDTDVNFSIMSDRFDEAKKHVDGFAVQSLRFDTEDAAMRSRQDRLEDRVERLERRIR